GAAAPRPQLHLYGLEGSHPGTGVCAGAFGHGRQEQLVGALGRAECRWRQWMAGRRHDRDTVERTAGERRTRMLRAAAAALQWQRSAPWHEQLIDHDVLAARSSHAHGVPAVDNLVVGLGYQAQAPVDWRVAGIAIDGNGQHIPIRVVHARGERPAAIDNETTLHFAPPTGGER